MLLQHIGTETKGRLLLHLILSAQLVKTQGVKEKNESESEKKSNKLLMLN